jgi:hypothetical protein
MNTEKLTTGVNWATKAIRGDHGEIDMDATLALCEEEIVASMEGEIGMDAVAGAVASALNNLTQGGVAQKASTDLNGLSVKALGLLGDLPAGVTTSVQNRIKNFIRGESDRFVETNGEEGICYVGRGRGFGGVNVRTTKFVEEYRAAQAKKAAKTAAAK